MRDTKKKSRYNWRPFEEARTFIHSQELKGRDEWRVWAKSGAKPDDIPTSPEQAYKDKGWVVARLP